MTQPILQPVFGADWHALPRVMQQHYALRAQGGDMHAMGQHTCQVPGDAGANRLRLRAAQCARFTLPVRFAFSSF